MFERKIDDIGRLLIPAEIRKNMGLEPGDKVRLSVNDGAIEVRKYRDCHQCKICHSAIGTPHELYVGLCMHCETDIVEKIESVNID